MNTPISNLHLMEVNPDAYAGDVSTLTEYLRRLQTPWLETNQMVALPEQLARIFEVAVDNPIVELLMENPLREITYGEVFKSGPHDVVFTRVLTITNAEAIVESIDSQSLTSEDHLFIDELKHFTSSTPDDPSVFVAEGVIFLDDNHRQKPFGLTSDGQVYPFKHSELDKYIPKSYHILEDSDTMVEGGDYHYWDRVTGELKAILELNAGVWHGELRLEWLVGETYDVIGNTVFFLREVMNDSLVLIVECGDKHPLQ